MAADLDDEFDKADVILAEALERFQAAGVSPTVFGAALFEIGVVALLQAGDSEDDIAASVAGISAKIGPGFVGPRRG